ncbi:MAG: prepilin-type N-terminal cleavage/methylation domain-containing protein [Clostridia bacterium]|nr:prepilin-type N-terminal cleavage/methylation domain-containing protein [Clostridia bacterium]
MKKFQNNKGFTLIELIVVIAIIAILAAVAVPSYNRIQDRAERSAALSNAQVIVNCINAHNAVADTDDAIDEITGAADATTDAMVFTDSLGTTLSTPDLFNGACENQISGMSDDDYAIALEYIMQLAGPDEFGLKEGYDHTT